MKNFYIGAAYYPEMWDKSEIEKDIARCKELGINTLRVGEFAWGRMEPEEGKYDLEWLAEIVGKLYANGIYTVMCTPTCTPPRWMLDKYEEMRQVTSDLNRADVSSRCHVCKTSETAREKNRNIVTQMAKVFAGCKGVIGWQIDNEIYPYGDGCYCDNCKAAFRRYLRDIYGSIENLNGRWGMARWSLEYGSFGDVQPPYPAQWRHPSLRKAWWEFQCGQIKSYVEEQAEILHGYGCKNVGTDMMQNNYLSYYDLNEKLDVVQFNHYNKAEDLPFTAYFYDFLRCVKDKPFWVTETQVGWNGSEYADSGYRPVGNCYANTILPLTKGAEMNLYWLFRTHPNGHELAHGALFSTAGRSYRVSQEVKKAVDNSAKFYELLECCKINSTIALHYSAQAENCFSSAPLIKGLDYCDTLVKKYHTAFRHYNVDVIDTPHKLDGYDVLISPFLAVVDEDLKRRVTEWVKSGGIWIVGPMTDVMNGDVTKFTHAPFGFLEELAGVYTKYQKPFDSDDFKARWADGTECKISICYDAFECNDGTESLAFYDGGEFDGLSAITRRKVGKGSVILVGSVISHADILRLAGKKPIAEASGNIILTERGNGIICAVETQNAAGYVVLNGKYKDLISGKEFAGKTKIEPYDALVLKPFA